ncbi:ShlB/FhaC/HecB family hemolysin secretion/activation protein [Marinovum sp. 2_MG-2023]|uniref:ShlB/FhaC/HecB family hemolysin secretion/activation protein n=1 Tax=unclassified Marinovum TaxID=2647166 RepID=UPI0026E1B34D|nr:MULTISPECIES: ShlB/FhaC/HecB family hemolysin secretion/activation protein [unclassified Marinovum]MDO6732835.1 ShlB/FhaC/HecB family hemolysin secretion/activation protein [Marinovum sp. 2_MG-2023]MDO6782123.1 ShlB/FhaC/HecB family hemolysin secretion/activation protein [Marinovum sp. 1_MG-2023]
MNGNTGLSRTGICLVAVVLWTTTAMAQTIPGAVEPGRTESRFERLEAPRAQPTLRQGLESTVPPAQAAQIPLSITGFRISGVTAFSSEALQAVVQPFQDQNGTLLDVFQAAAALTAFYGDNGFLLSRAIVPPQELEPSGAVITLQVIEGYVDRVALPENLGSRQRLLDGHARNVEASRPLNADQLEREMLLANDIPGLSVQSNLSASPTTPAASTLTLTNSEDQGGWGLRLDNRGSDASGPLQFTVSGQVNNLLGFNEQISGGLTLAGPADDDTRPELAYVFLGYDQVLNASGLRFSFDANYSQGDPDSAVLTALDYETEGFNASFALSYPFIRTRSRNLTGTLAFDLKNSESTNFAGTASEDRLRILRAELAFDNADQYNGTNQVRLAFHKGIEGLGSTTNSNPNASRTPGKVDFFRATLELSRTQALGNGFSLHGGVFGQWTNDPLLSSQECGFGGAQYGRGYDSSIITGDTCVKGMVELRYNVPAGELTQGLGLDYTQLYAFADAGRIGNIDAPLGTPSSDTASSAGFGARFGIGRMNFDITAAKPLNTPDSIAVDDDWQGFFSLSAQF